MKVIKINKEKIQRLDDLSILKFQNISSNLVNELSPIFAKVCNETNKEDKLVLKDFYIIRTVTLFEAFFTDWTIRLIDTFLISYDLLFKESVKFPNLDAEKNITKGKLIATNFNLQNLPEVDKLFSSLLNTKFFDDIRTFEFRGFEKNKFLENWDRFFKIFENRHRVVHSLSYHVNYSDKDIRELNYAIQFYLLAMDTIIALHLLKINPNALQKSRSDLYEWAKKQKMKKHLGLTLGPEQSTDPIPLRQTIFITKEQKDDLLSSGSSYYTKKSKKSL